MNTFHELYTAPGIQAPNVYVHDSGGCLIINKSTVLDMSDLAVPNAAVPWLCVKEGATLFITMRNHDKTQIRIDGLYEGRFYPHYGVHYWQAQQKDFVFRQINDGTTLYAKHNNVAVRLSGLDMKKHNLTWEKLGIYKKQTSAGDLSVVPFDCLDIILEYVGWHGVDLAGNNPQPGPRMIGCESAVMEHDLELL